MLTLKSLQSSAQRRAITGLGRRIPIQTKYSFMPWKAPAGSVESVPDAFPQIPMKNITPKPRGIGEEDIGQEGEIDLDASDLEMAMGDAIAGGAIGRGGKAAALTGLSGLLAKAPTGAIAKAIPGAMVHSALAPVGLINTVGGVLSSGKQAFNLAENVATVPEDVTPIATGLFTQAPTTLSGRLLRMAKGRNVFGDLGAGDVGDLAVSPMTNAPVDIGGETQSPFAEMGFETPTSAQSTQEGQEATAQLGTIQGLAQSRGKAPIGRLVPGDVGQGNAPATVATPGAVAQPGLFESGYSAPQGAPGTTTGNFGGADEDGGISGEGGTEYGGGEPGDVGGGEGTVICGELHRQGLMLDEIYEADCVYGASLDDDVMEGYQVWGKPLAVLMSKSQIVTTIVKYPALKWAENMAGNPNWFGSFAVKVGIPLCRGISRMLRFLKRQERSTSQSLRQAGLS